MEIEQQRWSWVGFDICIPIQKRRYNTGAKIKDAWDLAFEREVIRKYKRGITERKCKRNKKVNIFKNHTRSPAIK